MPGFGRVFCVLRKDYEMSDKRNYTRTKVNVPAVIFVQGVEIDYTVDNISPAGICFKLLQKDLRDIFIARGDLIDFHFVDSYNIGRNRYESIIAEAAKIKHVTIKEDFIYIGGSLSSYEYMGYVARRELSMYTTKKTST